MQTGIRFHILGYVDAYEGTELICGICDPGILVMSCVLQYIDKFFDSTSWCIFISVVIELIALIGM